MFGIVVGHPHRVNMGRPRSHSVGAILPGGIPLCACGNPIPHGHGIACIRCTQVVPPPHVLVRSSSRSGLSSIPPCTRCNMPRRQGIDYRTGRCFKFCGGTVCISMTTQLRIVSRPSSSTRSGYPMPGMALSHTGGTPQCVTCSRPRRYGRDDHGNWYQFCGGHYCYRTGRIGF
jgi:hypothetical protein